MIYDLISLLTQNTGEKGSWELRYNDHSTCYYKIPEEIKEFYSPQEEEDLREWEEEVKDIDWNKPIYELIWYKDTPVGSYTILGNSQEDICKRVLNIVENK